MHDFVIVASESNELTLCNCQMDDMYGQTTEHLWMNFPLSRIFSHKEESCPNIQFEQEAGRGLQQCICILYREIYSTIYSTMQQQPSNSDIKKACLILIVVIILSELSGHSLVRVTDLWVTPFCSVLWTEGRWNLQIAHKSASNFKRKKEMNDETHRTTDPRSSCR